MPSIRIPTPLRSYTQGQKEIQVQGNKVDEALEDLLESFPSLRPHLTNGSGELRPFVNLFLNQDNIKDLQGVETPLKEDDLLVMIPSIAGGLASQPDAS